MIAFWEVVVDVNAAVRGKGHRRGPSQSHGKAALIKMPQIAFVAWYDSKSQCQSSTGKGRPIRLEG